jgi:hypothetical protein
MLYLHLWLDFWFWSWDCIFLEGNLSNYVLLFMFFMGCLKNI